MEKNGDIGKMFSVKVKQIRCTPRKMNLVANFVQKKKLQDAIQSLRLMNKKAAPIVFKAILSLIAQIDDYITFNKNKNSSTDKDSSTKDKLLSHEDYAIKRLVVGKSLCLRRRFGRAKGRVDIRKFQYSMLYIEAIPHKFLIE